MVVMARNINITDSPASQNLYGQDIEWNSNAVNVLIQQSVVRVAGDRFPDSSGSCNSDRSINAASSMRGDVSQFGLVVRLSLIHI